MKNKLIKYALLFLSLMAAFFFFAVISCSLPDKAVKKHVSKEAPTMQEQGDYPTAIIHITECRQDNFTDALILNQIYSVDRKHPFKSAMEVPSGYYDPSYDASGSLLKTVNQEPGGKTMKYSRYWHGSTFLFRIFLIFVDYPVLQWLLFAISSLLLALFVCTYYARAGMWKTAAFLLSWLLVYGFIMQFSMQFFPVLALSLLASTLVVRHEEDTSYLSVLFFVIACLTCYFDILTDPLLTFGWPLVVWISLQRSDKLRHRDNLWNIIKWGSLWSAGYALTFLFKWGIGSLILGENVLQDASNAMMYRIGTEDYSRWDAIVRNWEMIPGDFVVISVIVLLAVSLLHFKSDGWFKAVLLLVVALMPFVWYLVLANHSYLHFWFTYRIQAITLSALFLSALSLHRKDSSKQWD